MRHTFSTLSDARLFRMIERRIQGRNALIRKRQFSGKDGKEGAEDMIPKDTVIREMIEEPTNRQLRIVALRSAIPMVGFGFMDNLVMIQAGEFIDLTIGVTFGISTLTAAGFGQCVSDVAGFTSGGIVDAAVAKLKLPHHNLSLAQLGLRRSRIYTTVGGCVGVVFGCLLGMTSLLFMDTTKAERMKKAKEMESIFDTVMEGGHELIHADRCALWMFNEDKTQLWSIVHSGTRKLEIVQHYSGLSGACAKSGEMININDAYKDPRFNQANDRESGFTTRSVLCVPVKDDNGEVLGVVQMLNKKDKDGTDSVFDSSDVRIVEMLAKHVACFTKVLS